MSENVPPPSTVAAGVLPRPLRNVRLLIEVLAPSSVVAPLVYGKAKKKTLSLLALLLFPGSVPGSDMELELLDQFVAPELKFQKSFVAAVPSQ